MKKLSIFNLFLAIFLVLNILILHSPILGVILGLGFIVLSSHLLNKKNLLLGFLLFLCAVILPLTAVYYIYGLYDWVVAGWLILFSSILILSSRRKPGSRGLLKYPRFRIKSGMTKGGVLIILVYFILLIICYLILRNGQTLEPVRSTWTFVSKWFFVLYFGTTGFLIFLIRKLKTTWALILCSLHLFFIFSIANIIWPLGFGFDSFIHSATEKYILQYGFILPKPFYYIGQYSLVTFLTKLFQISHVVIDKNLVPALAAILLPSTIYSSLKNKISLLPASSVGGPIPYSLFLFLIIPFSIFTFTTPQNLADLLVIVMAFLSLGYLVNKQGAISNKQEIFLMVLMALTVLSIHPIAGMAAMIFLLVLLTTRCKVKFWLKNIFYGFLCLGILLAFILFSFLSPLYNVGLVNNFNLVDYFRNTFRWIPDLFLNTNIVHLFKTVVYFLWQPIILFFIISFLAIAELLIIKKRKLPVTSYQLPVTFVILLLNSVLVFSFLNFGFLVSYERGDFAWRIFNLGVYFLIPLAMMALIYILDKVWSKKLLYCYIVILLIAGGVTVSMYMSYPRQDIYYYTRGYNTSIYDFNAVKYIEDNTEGEYVVLANQQVGVAALTIYGFRYFDDTHFFYSIPRGSDLYNIFHKIAYNQEINRETIKPVKDLTGVNTAYFYLNDYWFNFDLIAPELLKIADNTIIIEQGKVWLFKFDLTNVE